MKDKGPITYAASSRVTAIKIIHSATRMGLVDARHFVDEDFFLKQVRQNKATRSGIRESEERRLLRLLADVARVLDGRAVITMAPSATPEVPDGSVPGLG